MSLERTRLFFVHRPLWTTARRIVMHVELNAYTRRKIHDRSPSAAYFAHEIAIVRFGQPECDLVATSTNSDDTTGNVTAQRFGITATSKTNERTLALRSAFKRTCHVRSNRRSCRVESRAIARRVYHLDFHMSIASGHRWHSLCPLSRRCENEMESSVKSIRTPHWPH